MPLLDWKDEYLLGIGYLDFEHQDLFERINELYEMCAAREDSAHAGDCLGRLHARLSAHFALEEKAMREMKNPHYTAHKAAHDQFLDEVTDAVAHFGAPGGGDDLHAFATRVKDWIVAHITSFDRQLVEGGDS